MLSLSQRIGLLGEQWVWSSLRGRDLHVPRDFNDRVDMYISGMPVHIKTALPKRHNNGRGVIRNRWQWNVSNLHTPYGPAGLLILLAGIGGMISGWHYVPFFVPLADIDPTRKHISITSHPLDYNGWLTPYRENFMMLDKALTQFRSIVNHPLFSF